MKHYLLTIGVFLLFSLGFNSTGTAQVTIGSSEEPKEGALLDLKEGPDVGGVTASKGLLLPRVELTDRKQLFPMFTDPYNNKVEDPKHAGLIVYNTNDSQNDLFPGLNFWDGEKWNPLHCPPPKGVNIVCPPATETDNMIVGVSSVSFEVNVERVLGEVTYQWYTVFENNAPTKATNGTKKTFTFSPAAKGKYEIYCIVTADCQKDTGIKSNSCHAKATVVIDELLAGTGVIDGPTCFDVVEINDAGECGRLNARSARKADFRIENPPHQDLISTGLHGPQTRIQRYRLVNQPVTNPGTGGIITGAKTLYNVVLAKSGYDLIEKIVPVLGQDLSVVPANGVVLFDVYYKTSLNDEAAGRDSESALIGDILTYYEVGSSGSGNYEAVRLEIQVKDCICCGMPTVSGGWLGLACANLGANPNVNPFEPDDEARIAGKLYQWGRGYPAYSAIYVLNPSLMRADKTSEWLSSPGVNKHTAHSAWNKNFKGRTTDEVTPVKRKAGDTTSAISTSDANLNAALAGTGYTYVNLSTEEKANGAYYDPCPEGWRVPTQTEWESIYGLPRDSWKRRDSAGPLSGLAVGFYLFLPSISAVQFVNSTAQYTDITVGNIGHYASSSSAQKDMTLANTSFMTMRISAGPNGSVSLPTNGSIGTGGSIVVRCTVDVRP